MDKVYKVIVFPVNLQSDPKRVDKDSLLTLQPVLCGGEGEFMLKTEGMTQNLPLSTFTRT